MTKNKGLSKLVHCCEVCGKTYDCGLRWRKAEELNCFPPHYCDKHKKKYEK
jgi:hypothetical protein